jgi:hypothetical protein
VGGVGHKKTGPQDRFFISCLVNNQAEPTPV